VSLFHWAAACSQPGVNARVDGLRLAMALRAKDYRHSARPGNLTPTPSRPSNYGLASAERSNLASGLSGLEPYRFWTQGLAEGPLADSSMQAPGGRSDEETIFVEAAGEPKCPE
jgi:hypothetical protein